MLGSPRVLSGDSIGGFPGALDFSEYNDHISLDAKNRCSQYRALEWLVHRGRPKLETVVVRVSKSRSSKSRANLGDWPATQDPGPLPKRACSAHLHSKYLSDATIMSDVGSVSFSGPGRNT